MITSFETELKKKGVLVYRTKGISMLPLLRENKDIVIIETPLQLAVNDVVLFRRDNGAYVLHRIVSGNMEQGWIICGDNLLQMEPVRHDQIIGIMTSYVRDGIKTSVTDAAYRRYVSLLPLRRLYLRVYRKLSQVKHFVSKMIRNKRKCE